MRINAFHSPFDLFKRSNSVYMNNYQATSTPIIKTSENLYQDVVNEKASELLTNSLPNSIAKAATIADYGRRLNIIV